MRASRGLAGWKKIDNAGDPAYQMLMDRDRTTLRYTWAVIVVAEGPEQRHHCESAGVRCMQLITADRRARK